MNKRHILIPVILTVCLFLFNGCGDDNDLDISYPSGPYQLAAGFVTLEGSEQPVIWVGGTRNDLGLTADEIDYTKGRAYALDVHNDVVYTAGAVFNGDWNPCYWVGRNELHVLSLTGLTNPQATAFYRVEDTLHMTGTDDNDTLWYWNSDTPDSTLKLGNVVPDAPASMSGSGDDVYIAGLKDGSGGYWKNPGSPDEEWKPLVGENLGTPLAVTTAAGKVYMAGFYDIGSPRACYWMDGARTPINIADTTSSRATDIIVSGETVITGGICSGDGRRSFTAAGGATTHCTAQMFAPEVLPSLCNYDNRLRLAGGLVDGTDTTAAYWFSADGDIVTETLSEKDQIPAFITAIIYH